MKQLTQNIKSGEIKIQEVPPPALFNNAILVKNYFSLISVGTEKTSIDMGKKNMLQKARSRPDDVKKVLQEMKTQGIWATYKKVMGKLDLPKTLGYSSSGIVLAVDSSVENIKPGDRVACAGAGYAVHADVIVVPKNLCVKIPDTVSFEEASYGTVGSIALQGIRQTSPTLGEKIVVIGLGLLGQITVQMLKANGCYVIGVDIDETSVKAALKSGADLGLVRTKQDVKSIIMQSTDGFGADAVIITAGTGSNDPVELAGEIARERARVVLVGAVGMNFPRTNYYIKELEFKLSRSYGPGRYDYTYEEGGIDYPIGYVRWTENRNIQEFISLINQKKVDVKSITTHSFPIDEAEKAYDLISGEKKEFYLGILLKYEELTAKNKQNLFEPIQISDSIQVKPGKENLYTGFIGVGGHAQSFLLPNIEDSSSKIAAICDSQGTIAKHIAEKYQVKFCTSNPDDIINDDKINTIFIATRHGSHSDLVTKSLMKDKNIFVEKPLALQIDELNKISALHDQNVKDGKKPILFVAYNRRFAPLMKEVKNFFKDVKEPLVVNYRVNAGFLPKSHWTQDPIDGGGRILGEVCHFVDIVQFLSESNPEKVFAQSIIAGNDKMTNNDNINITLKMKNGALGIITYLANGDKSVPKERIEITGGNQFAILENFETLYLYKNDKKKVVKGKGLDKGHKNEVREFIEAAKNQKNLIEFENLRITSLTTFKILESLQTGEVLEII
jgi:predicted dehydrogenase/threonine dehydrogenase-like Zn-dependent dehydrogenase